MSGPARRFPEKRLFVDDRWIAEAHALHRATGTVERHPLNPLIEADRPWERQVALFGSVVEEPDGRFRCWYYGNDADPEGTMRWRTYVAYAESDDGVTWVKPSIGRRHPRHGPTNIVLPSSGRAHLCSPAVIRDDGDPDPGRRYKMFYWDAMDDKALARYGSPFPLTAAVPGWGPLEGEGCFVAVSPDGIKWRLLSRRPVFATPSDATAMSQAADGRYRAYVKTSVAPERHFRVIAESVSEDFRHWSAPRVVLEPDWRDPVGTEFYGMSGFDYFGNRLGLVWVYRNDPVDKRIDVEIASHDDEAGWQRAADRRVLLPVGPPGAWDGGCVVPASEPVVSPACDPGAIWLYYDGRTTRHDDKRGSHRYRAIGLARLRLDGFASLESRFFPGHVLTRPFAFETGDLAINIAAPRGRFIVTLVDADGGHVLAQSRETAGIDDVAHRPAWDVPPAIPAGMPVRLRVDMLDARLYAFWFDRDAGGRNGETPVSASSAK